MYASHDRMMRHVFISSEYYGSCVHVMRGLIYQAARTQGTCAFDDLGTHTVHSMTMPEYTHARNALARIHTCTQRTCAFHHLARIHKTFLSTTIYMHTNMSEFTTKTDA